MKILISVKITQHRILFLENIIYFLTYIKTYIPIDYFYISTFSYVGVSKLVTLSHKSYFIDNRFEFHNSHLSIRSIRSIIIWIYYTWKSRNRSSIEIMFCEEVTVILILHQMSMDTPVTNSSNDYNLCVHTILKLTIEF